MDCDNPQLFQEWVAHWDGLGVIFEIVPVITSKEAREAAEPLLNQSVEQRT